MKEPEWKETVDAISKSTHSNLIYYFTFIFYLSWGAEQKTFNRFARVDLPALIFKWKQNNGCFYG